MNEFKAPYTVIRTNALWIGPKSSRMGLHYDPDYRNILFVTEGVKRFYLFYPENDGDMYPGVKYDGGACNSKVNFWDYDEKKFPKFKKVPYEIVNLTRGDAIAIPAYVWHAVENLSTTVAFSYRCETPGSLLSKIPGVLDIFGQRIRGIGW